MRQVLNISLLMILIALSLMPTAFAAKTQPTPDFSEKPDPETKPSAEELERAKLVNITPVSKSAAQNIEESEYFYRFRHGITVRAGLEESFTDLANPGPAFGLLYRFPLEDLRGVEAGADLGRDGNGTLHFASFDSSGFEKFRWFYKFGGGIRIIASDQLVTFLRLRNWQARLSGGFELTISDPVSLRFDADSIWATDGIKILATLGIVFAW